MRKLSLLIALMSCLAASAQSPAETSGPVNEAFDSWSAPDVSLGRYFTTPATAAATPDAKGFIRRWTLLEPIAKPEIRTNAIFTDSWLRNEFAKVLFKDQMSIVPAKDGQKLKLDKKTTLKWHFLDSRNYNVKLYRFATGLGLRPTEGLFWAVTVIECPEDMNVRLAVGSNSASMWWLDGEEALLLSGDRRMVVDDCVSKVLTLKKGRNVLRGAVINGPGMSDFCVRFIGEDGKPVTGITVSNQ